MDTKCMTMETINQETSDKCLDNPILNAINTIRKTKKTKQNKKKNVLVLPPLQVYIERVKKSPHYHGNYRNYLL